MRIEIGPEFAREVAEHLAAILAERPALAQSPYLLTDEAAAYLRCSRQRVFDLTSQGRLRVCKDGARSLYRRCDLDAYLVDGGAA